MPAGGVIDLDRELEDIFKKEEMRAFFDFRITLGNERTTSGLCKISEPKKHASGSTYFSLLFLIDIPEQSTWAEIDTIMTKVEWDRLQKHLAHVESVMSLPVHKPVKEIYFSETFVYVATPRIPETAYLRDLLYPALCKVTGFAAGDLVVWEDATSGGEKKPSPETSRPGNKPVPPFLERLKRLLT